MLFAQLVLALVVGVNARILWREMGYRRRGL